MKRNSISFVTALMVVIAMAGGAQAAVASWGYVDTSAVGETVEVWLDNNPSDYVTVSVLDDSTDSDYWYVSDLTNMLDRNLYNSGDTNISATAVMYCSGTQRDIDGVNGSSYANTYENVTLVQFTVDYADGSYQAPMMNLTTCPAETHPDLIVESITPNCGGYLFGNESNEISVVIKNDGTGTAAASNVSFVLSDGHSATAPVSQLAAGANETVTITDQTIRSAGAAVTINVTSDCNGEVTESNETNNVTTRDVIVVNNGYKGKTYTGGSNITTVKSYDLNGNLVYSVGDSYYLSSYSQPDWTTYNASWNASDLPVAGTVKEARLYTTYTWDKAGVMPGDVIMSFNGFDQVPEDAHYWDEKLFSTSYPYGMLAYNVTDDFNPSGNYANLTNSHTGGGNVSMRGMMLVAIYEDDTEAHRQIFVNEEFDLLYGGSGKCTTPDEATAWAPITGPAIDMSDVAGARLITFAPGADAPESGSCDLIFNGGIIEYDAWIDGGVHQIGVSDLDVSAHLQSTGNLVGFQSNANYMEASNAFLVVTFGSIPGDVNGDGYLTTADATIVLQIAVRGEYSDVADVSGDGAVTSLDALMILQAVGTES